MKKPNTTQVGPQSSELLNQFHLVSEWLIRLSQSMDKTDDPELQKVLRFNRWYLGQELDYITGLLSDSDIEYPFCTYLTAIYAGNQSEVRELKRALNGNGKVWYLSGKPLSPGAIKQRLKELQLSMDHIAQALCPECRKEAKKSYGI